MDIFPALSKVICRTVGGGFDLLRGKFPPVVRIETTNACNARCTICPHREIRRPIAHMDDAAYFRLIDQCTRPAAAKSTCIISANRSSTRNSKTGIGYAKRKGIKKVKIFTNGSLLDRRRAEGLIAAGLDEIKISIDGADKEEFERIRVPLKFETVIENTARLKAMRNAAGVRLRIIITCCSTSDEQATRRSLGEIADDFTFTKIHNWGGSDLAGDGRRLRKPCSRLWRTLTVLAGGDVSLCCLDYDGQHLLGHTDENTSIGDVWSSPAYEQVRLLHEQGRQGEMPLCANCTKSFV